MIFEIISGGGGKLTGWGKNGPAHSFPGEKTDWGEIPACYGKHFDINVANMVCIFPMQYLLHLLL